MKYKSYALIYIFLTLLSTIFIYSYINDRGDINPKIEIDLTATRPINQFEIYINSLQKQPAVIIGNNNSSKYFLEKQLGENINFIRIDLGESIDNKIRINSINIKYKGQKYLFNSNDLSNWKTNDLKLSKINDQYVEYYSTGNDPFIYNSLNIKFENYSPNILLFGIKKFYNSNDRLFLLIYIILFAVIYLFINNVRYDIIRNFCFIFAFASSALTFIFLPDINIPGNFLNSVGRASYNDGFFSGAVTIRLFLSIIVGCIELIIFKYLFKLKYIDTYEVKQGSALTLIICISLILLYFSVDLSYERQLYLSSILSNDWDGSNVNYWTYLINRGELPYKDFWYPYSGFFLFELRFPYGIIISFVYKLIVYSALIYLFSRVVSSNFYICILFLLIIIIGREVNLFWGIDRYILSILLLLAFVNLYNNYKINNFNFSYSIFIFLIALVILFEPSQLLYALPGLFAILIYDFFSSKNSKFLFHFNIFIFVPLVIISLLYLYILYILELLPGLISFYTSADAMAQGSQVTIIPQDIFKFASFDLLIYSSTLIIFLITFLRIISTSGFTQFTFLSIGFASISLMVLHKHIIRPMDWQFLIIPFVYFIIYIIYNNKSLNFIKILFFSILSGIFFASPYFSHNFNNYTNHIYGGFKRLISSFQYLSEGNPAIEKFNSFKLDINSDEYQLIDFLNSKNFYNEKYYILSESQNLYILLKGDHPYNTNSYNMSPLSEQNNNLNWLIRHKPKYVILDKSKLNFDLVPSKIRNPLIYKFVTNNYSYIKTIGKYDILYLNGNNFDYLYWSKLLGNTIDLKYIPLFTKPYLCESNSSNNSNVIAEIKVNDKTIPPNVVVLKFHYKSGIDFNVSFFTSNAKSIYWINLDRLWFYNESLVDYITPVNANLNISLKKCSISNNRLY